MALRKRGVVQTTVQAEGVKKYEDDMKKATGSLDKMSAGAKGLDKSLREAGGAAGVAAAGVALGVRVWEQFLVVGQQLIGVYERLGQRGGAVAAVAGYFERIASPGTLERLQRLSGWHVSQQTIMESFNRTLEVGLVSQQEFEEWFQRTVSVAQTTGRNIGQTWEQVSTALRGGGAEALQGLGINIAEANQQMRELGLSADTVEGKSRLLDLALAQLRDITGEASNSATNLSETWEATTIQAGDFYDQVARIVSTSPSAIGAFEAFREKLFGIDGAATASGEAIARMAQLTIRSLALGIDWTARAVEGYARLAESIGGLIPGMESQVNLARDIIATAREFRGAAQAAFEAAGAAAIAPAGAGAQRQITPVMAGMPSQAVARAAARAAEAEPSWELVDITQMAEEALGRIEETTRAINEENQIWADIIGTQIDLETQRAEAEAETAEAQRTRIEEMAEAQRLIREEEESAAQASAQAAQERHDALMKNFDLAAGTVQTLGSIFGQIADQQEAAGKAADGWRKAMGVALGIEYTIRAIAAGAEAIGAFASLNILGGLAYTAQAVEYGVAAGLAFSKLAQGAGGGAGAGVAAPAASAGTFIPARTEMLTGPSRPSAGGNTYNVFSLGGSDSEVARAMAQAEYRRQRTGTVARVPSSGVRYEV